MSHTLNVLFDLFSKHKQKSFCDYLYARFIFKLMSVFPHEDMCKHSIKYLQRVSQGLLLFEFSFELITRPKVIFNCSNYEIRFQSIDFRVSRCGRLTREWYSHDSIGKRSGQKAVGSDDPYILYRTVTEL